MSVEELYKKSLEDAIEHPENYNDIFEGYENNHQKALALIDWQKDHIEQLEARDQRMAKLFGNKNFYLSDEAEYFLNGLGYRKKSDNVIELPCKLGTTLYFLYNSPYADKPDLVPRIYQTDDWYFEIDKTGIVINTSDIHSFNKKYDYYLGETVFLTKQEAEQALAKMKGGE